MSTAEIKEMAANVKQNLLDEPDWGKVESGVLMSVGFNEPTMNAELLNGCSINNDGSIVLNSFMSENEEYGPYIFFNLFLLSPQDPALHKSLLHENVKKLAINSYKPGAFPDDLTVLKSLEELILDIDYSGIPEQVYDLTMLKSIDINTNELTSIPENIIKLQNLETLIIRPGVGFINDNFSGLSKLKKLDINNTFTQIPDAVFKLNNLEGLIINNPVGEISDKFSDLSKLKNLDVAVQHSCSVSSKYFHSSTLEKLHLRAMRPIIPKEFDEMFRMNYNRPIEEKINISFQKI